MKCQKKLDSDSSKNLTPRHFFRIFQMPYKSYCISSNRYGCQSFQYTPGCEITFSLLGSNAGIKLLSIAEFPFLNQIKRNFNFLSVAFEFYIVDYVSMYIYEYIYSTISLTHFCL